VGALYVRKRPRVRLEPILSGGGQERGLRSGTVPSPLAVGLGAACSICKQEMDVRISLSWTYFIFFRKWEISNSVLNEVVYRTLSVSHDPLEAI
jgi:cysteine sulfinate desulfinase/cysteine desulfurase-like protein